MSPIRTEKHSQEIAITSIHQPKYIWMTDEPPLRKPCRNPERNQAAEQEPRRTPMYTPVAFAETDLTKLLDFIETHSFGLLVTQRDGMPFATHLPFLLERNNGPLSALVGHVARANPQWQEATGQTTQPCGRSSRSPRLLCSTITSRRRSSGARVSSGGAWRSSTPSEPPPR